MKYMSFAMDMMRRNTILLQIYFVLCFVPFAHCLTSVIKHEHATWYQASDSCGNDGLEFDENIFNEVGILHGKMFWLGKAIYSKTSDWIEILGCYTVTEADVTTTRTFTGVLCVAECQIKCWSISFTNFGYKLTTQSCLCSKTIPLTKTDMLACESKTYSSSYFFYQVYQGNVSNHKGRHCTTLNCRGGYNNLKAENCTLRDTSFIAGRCGNKAIGSWGKIFEGSLIRCISRNQLLLAPLNYCNINGHQNEAITSWTNVFRDVWNRQLIKGEGGYDHPHQCLAGELVQVHGQLKLNKIKKECNEVLDWFVCKSDTQTKHTDVNTLVSILPATKPATISIDIISENISNTTKMYSSETPRVYGRIHTNDERDPYKKGNDSETIGAVIGALLGACCMIAVLSVLIACKIRSKGIFTESNNHVYEDTGQVICSKTIYDDVINNTKNKNTPTASTQTYDIHESSSPVYNDIDESK